MFSPRMRGCSPGFPSNLFARRVFPAYARMFRRRSGTSAMPSSFPRIREDVPHVGYHYRHLERFSPHTRGCFHVRTARIRTSGVFPAYAGMFLCSSPAKAPYYRFPRIRGDIPVNVPRQEQVAQFSPRARGCSSWPQPSPPFGSVFPACAGMFCQYGYSTCCSRCFPRVRGDVPVAVSPNAAV